MKVILTGSTGFIGSEVLRQCLANSAITSIIALSRKPIPDSAGTENSRLKTVILKDFESYSEDILQDLAGAEACIWYRSVLLPPGNEANESRTGPLEAQQGPLTNHARSTLIIPWLLPMPLPHHYVRSSAKARIFDSYILMARCQNAIQRRSYGFCRKLGGSGYPNSHPCGY